MHLDAFVNNQNQGLDLKLAMITLKIQCDLDFLIAHANIGVGKAAKFLDQDHSSITLVNAFI